MENPMRIVNIINEYVRLVRDGKHFRGCCPFHKETTPSLYVNVSRQIWHCFGCHRGGDLDQFMDQMKVKMPSIEYKAAPIDQDNRDRWIDDWMMDEHAKLNA